MQIHALTLQEVLDKQLEYVYYPTCFGSKAIRIKRLKTIVKSENGTPLNFNTTLYFEKEEWANVFGKFMNKNIDIVKGYISILKILEVAKTLDFETL